MKYGRRPQFFFNGRRPQFFFAKGTRPQKFWKWKTTSNLLKMEDDLIFFGNGRQHLKKNITKNNQR